MKHIFKRSMAILLVLCMLMSVLPLGAFAASDAAKYVFDISEGGITIDNGDTEGTVKVRYGNGLVTEDFDPSQEITITGTAQRGNILFVDAKTPVTLKLDNLRIDNKNAAYCCAVEFGRRVDVTMVLVGQSYVAGGRDRAGIRVPSNSKLTIEGSGSLEAVGYYMGSTGAGIGGNVYEDGGTVIINSGVVTATGGRGAAGIGGGGYWMDSDKAGTGGKVIINGGTVTVNGGSDAAAIGGGIGKKGTGSLSGSGKGWIISNADITCSTVDFNGVILRDGNAKVYGDATLTEDREANALTIDGDNYLTVPQGTKLTVNGELENNGTLLVADADCLNVGTLKGFGRFLSMPTINVPTGLVETGAVLSPAVSLSAQGFTYQGITFDADTNGWSGPVFEPGEVKDAGEYTVSYTRDGHTISEKLAVDCLVRFDDPDFPGAGFVVPYGSTGADENVPELNQKPGYTGIWVDAEGNAYDPAQPIYHSKTYTAEYTPNEYTVYYGNDSMTVTYDAPFTVPAGEGEGFIAWSGDDGRTYLPLESMIYRVAGDLHLTALFDRGTEYAMVKFVGENGYVYDVALVEKGTDDTVTAPVYTPYPDAVWVNETDPDDVYQPGQEIQGVEKDMTFVVKVPGTVTVTYIAGGQKVAQYTLRRGQALEEIPEVPEKTGYTGYWDTQLDNVEIVEDMTVNAVYQPRKFLITYCDANGAVLDEQEVYYNEWFTARDFDGELLDGQSFKAWQSEEGQFFLPGRSHHFTSTQSLTVYPVFDADTSYWTVKFCHPDGSLYWIDLLEQTNEGTEYDPNCVVYTPYPDAKWMLDFGADEGKIVEEPVLVQHDLVFTAVVPETYTILFKSEEGYLMDVRFLKEDEPIGEAPEAPAKEGYHFIGWQNEQGEMLEDGTQATENATYRPVYEAISYPIKLIPSEHVQLFLMPSITEASVGDVVTLGTVAEKGYETYNVCVYYENAQGEMVPVAITPSPVNAPNDSPDRNLYSFVMPAGPVTVWAIEEANRNNVQFLVDGKLYAQEFIRSGERPAAPQQPEKEGYTFQGWMAQSTDKLYAPGEAFDPITANETYEAVFEINDYDLTYYRGAEADESAYKCVLTLPDGSVVEFFNNDTMNMPTYVIHDVTFGDTVELAEPILPGFVFQGWKDEKGYIHPAGAKFRMPAQDVLLTALWEADTQLSCLVRFVSLGQTYSAFLAYDGQTASIPAVDPTIPGKTFLGWKYGENIYSNKGVKSFEVIASDERDMTFEALWEDELYTVTFVDTATYENVSYGTELITPQAPELDGSTFVAWKDVETGAYYFANTAFTVTSDKTFEAVWAKDNVEYVLKFFGEKGNLYDIFVSAEGEIVTAPTYEEGRADAEYVWYDEENGAVVAPGQDFTANGDRNFRAVLIDEATYPVRVMVAPDDAPANVAQINENSHRVGENVNVYIRVPQGYVLKSVAAAGWNGEILPLKDSLLPYGDGEYLYVFEMPAAMVDILVTLEPIPAGYTAVKFMNNGALYDYVLVEKGTNGTAPEEAPSMEGYAFVEWRSEDGFVLPGGLFAVAVDAPDEIIYRAVYNAEEYAVHYNMNGGLNASGTDYADAAPVFYNQTITLPDAAYLDGFTFVGWREDATGILYGAKGTYVVKGNASFTAVWEAAEYLVRFIDPNTGIIYGYEPISEGKQVLAPAAPLVSGKTFTHWENKDNAEDKVLASSLTPNILRDTTYYAMYDISSHAIGVVTDRCQVALNVAGTAKVGTAIQFTVTPNEGCAVDSVVLTYVDGLSTVIRELHPDGNGVYTFIMPDADVTITAKAVQNVYSIFTSTDANAGINLSSNKAAADSVVSFTLDVNEGYTLKELYVLTESGKPVALSVVEGVYTFVMPREDVTITAVTAKAEYSVTYLDSDNTILAIVPVADGELAAAPQATKPGYTFDHWEILPLTDPVKTFDPAADAVKGNLIVRAVYVGDTFTVQAGLVENVYALNAECTVSSGNTNSSNLLLNKLNAEAGKYVTFTLAANYDWAISGVAIVGLEDSKTIVEPILRLKETVDGINYYTVSFTMPAENVKIDVYTVAKLFRVDVVENIPAAGEYTINGYYSNNLMVAQGETVTIDIAPIPGYQVVDVVGTFFDGVSRVSLVDCTLNEEKTQFTFPMVAKDVHIEIIYAPIGYNIDVQTSNFLTYKPKTDVNPAVVVESLDPALTSQGRIELLPLELENYTNEAGQVYKIPANGIGVVGDRISFRVVEYTGYVLDTISVTYDNGECTCPLTLKDGIYYFDMPSDAVTITAVFKPDTFKVTKDAAAEAHGQVELNGLIENYTFASYKDIVTVDVTPDEGYQVSKIYYTLDNTSVMDFDAASYTNAAVMTDVLDTEHSISFHMPASDVKVYVEYIAIDYTVSTVVQNAAVTDYVTPSHIGDQVNFHVEANYGYTVSKVYVVNNTTGARVDRFTDDVNGTYGADYYFAMPASSVTIYVETVKDIYNVEYRDNGDLIGGEKIPYKETAHVTDFTALISDGRPGYHFVGWTSAQTETPVTVPSNNNEDFVIVRHTTIVAAYDKDEIHVHFLPTENGTVTEQSTGNKAEYVLTTTTFGDTVTFTAEPDEGYVIDTVRVYTTNADGYVLDLDCTVSGSRYAFVIPATFKADIHHVQAADVNVSVTFMKDGYTLTEAADSGVNGTVAVNGEVNTQDSFNFRYQDEVTITATPDTGYYVVSVTAQNADGSKKYEVTGQKPAVDTASGDPLTLTFRMPACDLSYTVVYAKCDYSITYVADASRGSVTSQPKDIGQIDDVVTVTVTPGEGYRLDTLTVTYANGEKSCELTKQAENVYTFTMPAQGVVITATFTELTYVAKLKINGQGTATLNGYYTVNMSADYLETVTVNVMPESGWELSSISVNGGAIKVNEEIRAEGGNYTFTMPAQDVEIVVTLRKTGYDMTAHALTTIEEGHGTVTLDPKDTAYVGDNVVITADPDDGYRVANVAVLDENGYAVPVSRVNSGSDYVESWRFTMPARDVSIYVTFEVYGSSYYTDVRTDFWFFDAVTFVTDRGYFRGVDEGLFGPYMNMDRAMFVTVLGRMDGVDKNAPYTASFTDVPADSYFAPYVAWAAENGIILGRDDGTFDPYADITREEMAAIMYRFCKYLGIDMTTENEVFMDRYTDREDISPWAVTYMEWAVGIGLMRGMSDTTLDPLALATRAQVAQVIKNLCDKVLYA